MIHTFSLFFNRNWNYIQLLPIILVSLFLSIAFPASGQNIYLNEIMSSNGSVLADEDGDFEDWIELFNRGDETVQLEGFGLSDDYDQPFRWIFPDVTIGPGEFIIVWVSGKDRTNPGSELHTNYGISSGGVEILLTHPDGSLLDELPSTEIPGNISIGRQPDGIGSWVFFSEPTPGEANVTERFTEQLEPPVISHQSGFYTEDIQVKISHPDPDIELYYTLDGSEPFEKSNLYNESITFTDRSNEPNLLSIIPANNVKTGVRQWMEPAEKIRKGNIVRVKAIKEGALSSTKTKTFFNFKDGADSYNLPVISLVTDYANLFDEETGIYVPGVNYEEGNDNSGNYTKRGIEWERPARIELFENNGTLGFAQNIGIRIHGGHSRHFPLKSLRLYARSAYGESRFNYKMFEDLDDDSFNRLILRGSGNDFGFTMFMDAAAQSLIRHFNVDTQAYRPFITFINGEYWGIHNIRERYDRRYLERVYGANPDNIDLLTGRNIIKEGDNLHYNDMVKFIIENDLSVQVNYDEVLTRMDIDNFLDYYSAQIYYGNTDWPQNNIDFWRSRTMYNPDAPKGLDGRWRWLLYDVDRSLGFMTNASFDMIEWVTLQYNIRTEMEWPNLLLRNLLENESFYFDFINRISDHLNTAFTAKRVSHVIDSLKTPLKPVIDEHIIRWQNHESRERWEALVDDMFTYATDRPDSLRQHLMKHFDIGELSELKFDVSSEKEGYIRVNSTDIAATTPGVEKMPYPWSGTYFSKVPINLSAQSYEGYRFSHWTVNGAIPEGIDPQKEDISLLPEPGFTYKAHFTEAEGGFEEELIHYWVFTHDLPNNTPLEQIEPVYTNVEGAHMVYQAAISPYPPVEGTEGTMDRVNDPTNINYFPYAFDNMPFTESGMRGIRVRNPSLFDDRESSLLFHLPTTGFENPEFTLAAVRTSNGQRKLKIEYSTSANEPDWSTHGMDRSIFTMFETYKKISVPFIDIENAANNADFRVRISFAGDEEIRRGDSGNVRINNVLLSTNDTNTGGPDDDPVLPNQILLKQNFPNPFNPATVIEYVIPENMDVHLSVYNITGKRMTTLVDEPKTAGTYRVIFDASQFSSGVYLYKLIAGNTLEIRKMTLIK